MGSRYFPVSHDETAGTDDAPLVGEARPMRLRLVDSASLLPDKLARRRRARRLMLRELALLSSAGSGEPDRTDRHP